MKIFDKDGKTNFVDDNNVFVGFDNSQYCYENFGHFLSRKIPNEIDEGAENIDPEGFYFDVNFFQESSPSGFECGGLVIFRLVKGDEEIFLTLYNSHNGYYSHGFEMSVGGTTIQEGSL